MASQTQSAPKPQLIIEYNDAATDVTGYLIIDSLVDGLAAGGFRVREGLSKEELIALARNMTLKQAASGIAVGGAKGGLNMDPHSPECAGVIRRFYQTLRPIIENTWNCGPDLNTTMVQLEGIAREAGIPSLKIAVARNRGLSDEVFLKRYGLFESTVGGLSINRLRAPTAVYAAIKALIDSLELKGKRPRVAIQGAGNMGGATAWLLSRADIDIVAWGDAKNSIWSETGLDVQAIDSKIENGMLPAGVADTRPTRDLLEADCDVLVLAAISNAFGAEAIPKLRCRGIVQAANLALRPEVETAVYGAGITVIPDLLASVGGSLAVESLYKSAPETGQDILDHVERRASTLTVKCIADAKALGCSPREALAREF